MSEEALAVLMLSIITLSTAGVLILRPLAKQMGEILEQLRRNRGAQVESSELARTNAMVAALSDRMEQIEERLDFAERVLESGRREANGKALSRGASTER